ncbi:MAG: tRNA pseudouridine(55) synthase TruB [Cyanobacteria bacterium J06598_3]
MTSGFINLNKPLTWTSHDCVARVRRLLQTKKVGHGGTLDPLATGVLPIAVGRATRLIQYLPGRKSYQAVIRFGVTTTTDDLEGDILTTHPTSHLSLSAIKKQLEQFVGDISQVPPMYSAIQVDGQRLYDLARKGKTADVPVRQVTIHRLRIQGWTEQPCHDGQDSAADSFPDQYPELTLEIDCGPGTYIRSLARDLGAAAGTGATLAGLTRTHSNGFDLAESLTLEALEIAVTEGRFVPCPAGETVAHLEAIALTPALSRRWCMGQKIAFTDEGLSGEGTRFAHDVTSVDAKSLIGPPLRVINHHTGDFLGIGEVRWVPPVGTVLATTPIAEKSTATAVDLNPILAAKRVFAAVD